MGDKINILTRCSRLNEVGFGRTLTSVKEQGVNVNWFISYETQEAFEYLKKQDLPKNTTLVKVPKYDIIKGLGITYHHHDIHTDYLNWDWKKWKVTPYMGEVPEIEGLTGLKSIKYEKNGYWVKWFDFSHQNHVTHFPVNLYLKILEAQVQEGWIIHLDDGNVFESKDSLKKLQEEINKHDEDTLHVFKLMNMGRAWTTPQPEFWKYYQTGLPLVMGECSGSCLCFNTKWKNYTAWDEWRFADYRTARCLESVIPKRNLLDLVIIWCCDTDYTLELQRTKNPPYNFNS